MKNICKYMAKLAKRGFLGNDKGSISIMAGLSMVGVCLAIGAGIDFGRTTSAHSRLAAALDVAALHVAGMIDKTDAQLLPIAEDVMLKNYGGNTYDQVTGFSLVSDGNVLKVQAKVTVKTWFMAIGGIYTTESLVKTEAIKGSGGNSLEVALVLDNTGSMSDDIGALRDAANDFVDLVIQVEQLPYFSKAAVVPYSAGVNPGTTLRNQVRFQNATSGCTSYGCSSYTFTNTSGGQTTRSRSNCVTERIGAGALSDISITANKAAPQYHSGDCVSATVQPLTKDKVKLHTAINAMGASGWTAGQTGIEWGWYMLAPDSGISAAVADPEAKGVAYNTAKVKKIMIIMTDGEFNTAFCNGVYAKNNGTSHSPRNDCDAQNGTSNNQAISLCTKMKAAAKNITLYFVGFNLPASATVTSLKNACSTSSSHIIDANNQAELKAAFVRIAAELSSMRLSM